MTEPSFAAWVAIDWADRKHYWRMAIADSASHEKGSLDHTPQAIDRWAIALQQRFPQALVAVCLEQSRGPLAYQLAKYDHLVLYPVHPAAVARFRAAFFPSGQQQPSSPGARRGMPPRGDRP